MTKSNTKMDTATMEHQFRKRKSVQLSKEEVSGLKKYRKGYNTVTECAISIGIDRNVLDRILLTSSGSPETIEKIKAALKKGFR